WSPPKYPCALTVSEPQCSPRGYPGYSSADLRASSMKPPSALPRVGLHHLFMILNGIEAPVFCLSHKTEISFTVPMRPLTTGQGTENAGMWADNPQSYRPETQCH